MFLYTALFGVLMTPARPYAFDVARIRHLLRVCCCPGATRAPRPFALRPPPQRDTANFHVRPISAAHSVPRIHRASGNRREYTAMVNPLRSLSGVETLADRLDKPQLDDCSYRIIQLPNELEVLLIHDPEADKAAAAMDVNVGSFSDALDMPGMAHAVEHLLFMGTEKVRQQETERKRVQALTHAHLVSRRE